MALTFDGTDSGHLADDSGNEALGSAIQWVTFWLMLTVNHGSERILSWITFDATNGWILTSGANGTTLVLKTMMGGLELSRITHASPLTINKWYFIAQARNLDVFKLYVGDESHAPALSGTLTQSGVDVPIPDWRNILVGATPAGYSQASRLQNYKVYSGVPTIERLTEEWLSDAPFSTTNLYNYVGLTTATDLASAAGISPWDFTVQGTGFTAGTGAGPGPRSLTNYSGDLTTRYLAYLRGLKDASPAAKDLTTLLAKDLPVVRAAHPLPTQVDDYNTLLWIHLQ